MKNVKLLVAALVASCALPAFAQNINQDANMSYPHKMCDQGYMHHRGSMHHNGPMHHRGHNNAPCPYANKADMGYKSIHGQAHRFMHQPYYDDPDFIYVKAMVDLPEELHADVKKLQALKDELYVKKQVLHSLRKNPNVSASRVESAARDVIAARSTLREFNIVFHKKMANYYAK